MSKKFLDTFPTLSYSLELKELLDLVDVLHINYTRDKSSLRIYIKSPRLIDKKEIFRLEDLIEKQLFSKQNLKICIIEYFQLSQQYTPAKLLDAYYDSILLEFERESRLEYNLLRRAKWKFDADNPYRLTLLLEKSVLSVERKDEIYHKISNIFSERCGFEITINIEFVDSSLSNLRKQMEEREHRAVLNVLEQNGKRANGSLQEQGDILRQDRARVNNSANNSTENVKNLGDNAGGADINASESLKLSDKPSSQSLAPNNVNRKNGMADANSSYSGRRSFKRGYKKSDNPAVIYGKDFNDEPIEIKEIQEEMGEVCIRGKVLDVMFRELRNGEKTIVSFPVTDMTDTIMVKMFINNEFLPDLKEKLKSGVFVTVRGMTLFDRFDKELGISSLFGIRLSEDFTHKRMDLAMEKRVELHCHTKMSEMDGVSEVKDIIKQARSWGHKALAITDHGCAYAFPDAFHTVGKDEDFKVIYGVEGYLVDDLKEIVTNSRGQSLDEKFVVFDIETTGFSPLKNKIIEIGAVKVEKGKVIERFSVFVNPEVPIPFKIEKLTHIDDTMVVHAETIEQVLPKFIDFCDNAVLVAHNADFDMSFILRNAKLQGFDEFNPTYVDTVGLARVLLPNLRRFKLDTVAKELGVSLKNHHRAVDDAEATAGIFLRLNDKLKAEGIANLDEVKEKGKSNIDIIKKSPTYHIIVLAKNEVGRINLYRLISLAHINYFSRRPRFPKSELLRFREGLIFGSACEAGELYQALLRGESESDIARIVNFYDYLEIQPLGNNEFLLEKDDEIVKTIDDLKDLNRKIVKLGTQFDKPVVATCDVHFLNPEDEIYRRIIMAGQGFGDADKQPPLYLRTTEEMLKEFEYLGSDKAREVVITNTNLIADSIERIEPVRPDKCPPVIENSDKDLREMCYKKAISMYGDPLPKIVEERLERELTSIISNGFAVMYIIAQKLVKKSNDDGYMVGSRGSVGSSFVATMAGITEVNPLSPHYYCEKCHYNDFYSDEVRKFAGGAGCDMPDKNCPVCGEKLIKAGFDIPFETFLGFKGNKEPDIDLNFSGEYQSKAHDYTEVIFGKGHTFRAGTIGTLADKTAFGYVKNYYDERGQHKRTCEINRIVQGCTGVKKSSGQHPGGIIVLPHGEEICSFTPVQRPANDMTTKTITTHFDYHSIDHNLLKLDILGHDDPTMIRMLQDLTGIDMTAIPLDNKEVMSLFKDTSALGISPDDIGGCKLGALGIPEFGTDFAMQMLIDTKPRFFSDLVRIAGLSHGTDVWLGNAQTLIEEGKATISTAICTRDDIMTYLINQGMDKELSFTIMESVRKGKGLKPEWETQMTQAGVPDWYIWSCKKIKYMFPKAHAAAYVMMAWRIAYCKVFYPLAYYAAFFSIRATAFSYELMCMGQEKLEIYIADYKKRNNELSKKEQDTLRDMRIVQEMYVRGFEFLPIDLYKSEAYRFQIVDKKLLPSFTAIDGLGGVAAETLVEEAKKGKFLSKDDLRIRAKLSKNVIDKMSEVGLLEGMPESNQLSLFDCIE